MNEHNLRIPKMLTKKIRSKGSLVGGDVNWRELAFRLRLLSVNVGLPKEKKDYFKWTENLVKERDERVRVWGLNRMVGFNY